MSLSEMVQRLPGWGNWIFNRVRALIPERPAEESVSESSRKAKQKSSKSIRAVIEEALPEAAAETDWIGRSFSRSRRPFPLLPKRMKRSRTKVFSAQVDAGDYELPDPDELLSDPTGPMGHVG